ncbi:hypothetical protein JI435_411830 [Parastagonospora nodorum SN15]|uniref:Uncharacterized protein n=1 Tax=Phaeosphaeria nodorum (strain SN15 / ATCC MYA-4574 / FGSC 10173) TaxID=321614 RepID=A0A7U2I038_PHANO|nr:hypothetical protein JI435_411830 [Parastagonospora nodorum SN15]
MRMPWVRTPPGLSLDYLFCSFMLIEETLLPIR